MNKRQRVQVAIVLSVALLAILTAWSFGRLKQSHQAARIAAVDLASCQQASAKIKRLRQKPSMAGSEEMQLTEMARVIEQAAGTAQMPMDSLVRIWPDQARRVADTAYMEKPTHVQLRQVTLRQIITFLHALSDNETGLHVKHIRLTAPRREDVADYWSADATITYLIYAPQNQGERRLSTVMN